MRASVSPILGRLRHPPPWLVIGLAALALRLPLILLPGIGRDEAAYHYWAQSGEPAYAPLFLLLIRLCGSILPDGLLAVRMTAILGGLAVLALLDLHLCRRGVAQSGRYLAAATLAFTPWQTYVGAILHPDTIFLAALLVFVISACRRQLIVAAIAIGGAALAKPTGVVLLAVLIWLVWYEREASRTRRLLAILLAFGLVAPAVFLWTDPDMVQEIMSFGRLAPHTPCWLRGLLILGSLLFLAGPLLPLAAWQGVRDRWTVACRRNPEDPEGRIVLVTSLALVVTLGAAAILNGQFKANWYLPVLVLLWPNRPLRLPRATVGVMLGLSILASVGLTVGFSRPGTVAAIEQRLDLRHGLYPILAGTREARVSATRCWSDRLGEYQSMTPFATEIAAIWRDASESSGYPDWIVADDYGVAAQLAYHWRDAQPDLAVPTDGLYQRRARGALEDNSAGKVVIGVQIPLQLVWPELGPVAAGGTVANPVTGGVVYVGIPCSQSPRGPADGCPGDPTAPTTGGAKEKD